MTEQSVRKVVGWQTRALGEQAGDIRNALDGIPRVELRTLEGFYTEPLILGQLTEEPFSIEAVRIVSIMQPETAVISSAGCSWVWRGTSAGAEILSINGLTPSTAIKYRMFFRVTYEAVRS